MSLSLTKFSEAGIAVDELSEEERMILGDLTADEAAILISVHQRVRGLSDVQGHGDGGDQQPKINNGTLIF